MSQEQPKLTRDDVEEIMDLVVLPRVQRLAQEWLDQRLVLEQIRDDGSLTWTEWQERYPGDDGKTLPSERARAVLP